MLELNLTLTLTDLLLAATDQILIAKIKLVLGDAGYSGILGFPVTLDSQMLLTLIGCSYIFLPFPHF